MWVRILLIRSMTSHPIYDDLDPKIKTYVDALVDHAASALWPERKSALLSFWRGIANADPNDLSATLKAIGLCDVSEDRLAEIVFRVVLTAYLERLADKVITNSDQALLFCYSLDPDHIALGDLWLAEHPEFKAG